MDSARHFVQILPPEIIDDAVDMESKPAPMNVPVCCSKLLILLELLLLTRQLLRMPGLLVCQRLVALGYGFVDLANYGITFRPPPSDFTSASESRTRSRDCSVPSSVSPSSASSTWLVVHHSPVQRTAQP